MNLRKAIIFLFTLGVLVSGSIFAQDVKTTYYIAKEGENLETILKERLFVSDEVLYNQGYLEKLKIWNPDVLDINNLEAGTRIYIELPYEYDLSVLKQNNTLIDKEEPISETDDSISKGMSDDFVLFSPERKNKRSYSLSAFYTISQGTFEEEVTEFQVKATSSQNSPLTLGIAGGVFPEKSRFFYTGSLYLAKLDSAFVKSFDQNNPSDAISLPMEYGATVHFNRALNFWNKFSLFAGLDFERFSTYNTDEIQDNPLLRVRRHSVVFATIGFSKIFDLWNKQFLLKANIGQSVYSSASQKSLLSDEDFAGQKLLIYLNMKIYKRFLVHALYKHHILSGPTELVVNRVGIGFGYKFL